MKPHTFRHFLCFIIILVLYFHLTGCASLGPTKPNLPYSGKPYPVVLNELALTNPLLVQELGKLPEIQDGISEKEMYALNDIVELYRSDPTNFENTFNEMYNVGLPEFRKYCSLLQAIFWLAEDQVLLSNNNLISDFALKKLLKIAWNTDPLYRRRISDQQIKEIIDGIEDKDIKEMYLDDLNNGNTYYQLQSSFAADYRRSQRRQKNIFSKHSAKIIVENLLEPKSLPRWEDFYTVADRLNAPELLDYYIDQHMVYKRNRDNYNSPSYTFMNNRGDCDDLAIFGNYILRKGGYSTSIRYVHWSSDNRGHVGVVVFLEDGRFLIAIDFGSTGENIISGPYMNMKEVDSKLSYGNNYHDSGWKVYRP